MEQTNAPGTSSTRPSTPPPSTTTPEAEAVPALRRAASTGALVGLRRRVVATLEGAQVAQVGPAHSRSSSISQGTTPLHTPRPAQSLTGDPRDATPRPAAHSALPRAASLGAGLSDMARDRARGDLFHPRTTSLSSVGDRASVSSTANHFGANFALPEHRTLAGARNNGPILKSLWGHEGRFFKQMFSDVTGAGGGGAAGSNSSSAVGTPSNTGLTPPRKSAPDASGVQRPSVAGSSVSDKASAASGSRATTLGHQPRAHHLQTLFATEVVLPQLYASDVQLPRLFATAEQQESDSTAGRSQQRHHKRSVSECSDSGGAFQAMPVYDRDGKPVKRGPFSSSSCTSRSLSYEDSRGEGGGGFTPGGDGNGGGGDGGGSDVDDDLRFSASVDQDDDAFLYGPANFSGYRSRNLNALHAYAWDRRLFLPTTRWCLTRFFTLFASPRFWEKIDWTVRGSIFTILPTMVLCLEPTTKHIFPLPTSVVSYAYWFSQPTFGAGLREMYVVLKGFSVSLVVFCIFLAIRPGPVWLSLLLMFVFVLVISFFAEQTKRTSAWCICSLTMQYTRTPVTTTYNFIGEYYVTLLIGIGFGLASFIVPYIRWSSENAEHYLAVVVDSISLSARGVCACFWASTPLIRQLHLARLRQLRATTEKSFAKMKTLISEMGYEPHRGVYTAQMKTRSAFFTQIWYLQRSLIQMLEDVGRRPEVVDTPLCRAFAVHIGPALAEYGSALDNALVAIGRVDEIVSEETLQSFRDALAAFQAAITATREVVVLNNPDYQTDESDILLGFYLFHLTEMGRLISDFKENPSPPNNLVYLLRLPERDIMSLVNACRALGLSVWQRHTITRRLKESIKLSLCLFIAGIFQVYAMKNNSASVTGGIDIIAWVYRDTGGESFAYSTQRLLGTVLGSLTGWFGVQIANSRRAVLYVLSTILCFIGAYIMASPGWAALGSAMVMSVVSMTMQFRSENAAIVRIQQNCFAILIYFILSSFIWPVKARKKVKMGLDLSLRSFREAVWRLFRNLDLPESESNVAADTSLLLTQMQKRISVQEGNLVGAAGEPTFDSAEFPSTEWRAVILDQRHLMLSLLSMRFAYQTFMSSKVDGALSVHWRVLHRMAPAAAEFSELVFAACDIYLLTVTRANLIPTAHLTRIRESLAGCYADMLRAYITTIHQVLRGEFDDVYFAHGADDDGADRVAPSPTAGFSSSASCATGADEENPQTPGSAAAAAGGGGGGRAGAVLNTLSNNNSFADFHLSAQEVGLLRQLLRGSAGSETAGVHRSPTTLGNNSGLDSGGGGGGGGSAHRVSSRLNTRPGSALNTANNTFVAPPAAGFGQPVTLNGEAPSFTNSFFPGAIALDSTNPSANADRNRLQRVHEMLNRSFLGRGGGASETATAGGPLSPLNAQPHTTPSYDTAGGAGGGGAGGAGGGIGFTLNSSIVLPRGSYVPSLPQDTHHHNPHSGTGDHDHGSLMSNVEDVVVSPHDAAMAPSDPVDKALDHAPPVTRRSRLLSHLRHGGKTHGTPSEPSSQASPLSIVPPPPPPPNDDEAPSSPPGSPPGDDVGGSGSLVPSQIVTRLNSPRSHRSSSPPTPHNMTFIGPSGAGHGLNASFIPTHRSTTRVPRLAAGSPASPNAHARAAVTLPEEADATVVDLFNLPRHRGGGGGGAAVVPATHRSTPVAGTVPLGAVSGGGGGGGAAGRAKADDAKPIREEEKGTDKVTEAAPTVLPTSSLTLSHSPDAVPSALLTPLVPTAQFHAEAAAKDQEKGSGVPGDANHERPAQGAPDNAGSPASGAGDGYADTAPPAVLTSRDIHSLEAFLYGVNSLLGQLDAFEQHLLEVVHASEMAKKL